MRRHILAALTIAWVVFTGGVSWRLLIPSEYPQPAPTPGVAREDFTVDFGDFRARAQLTYPVDATTPLPAVFLVAGTGPADMDVTIAWQDGKFSHRLFRDISDSLTLRGYATVRYNKRYVKSATDHPSEEEYPHRVTPQQLQADLDRVYAIISTHPRIDRSRIILYGWSEGALIATGMALDHPEVAGVILHAPLSGTYKESSHFQLFELGQSFLHDEVDADRDGYLTEGEISAAWRRDVAVSLQPLLAILTESSWTGRTRVHRGLDWDSDGRLNIATEISRPLAMHVANWDAQSAEAGLAAYTTTGQPPPIRERLPGYARPLLLLHDENDGSVPATETHLLAARLAEAQHQDYTVRLYPGLGHILGPSTNLYSDIYAPITPDVLREIGDWLDQHYRR
jgi:dienelactone hydrolase